MRMQSNILIFLYNTERHLDNTRKITIFAL